MLSNIYSMTKLIKIMTFLWHTNHKFNVQPFNCKSFLPIGCTLAIGFFKAARNLYRYGFVSSGWSPNLWGTRRGMSVSRFSSFLVVLLLDFGRGPNSFTRMPSCRGGVTLHKAYQQPKNKIQQATQREICLLTWKDPKIPHTLEAMENAT